MSKIESFLEQYGLTEYESQSYIGLLKRGPSSIMDLSKFNAINRSTTHIAISSLINKGIVTQSNLGGRRVVIAEPPEKLSILIENEKNELTRKENSLSELVSSIHDMIQNVKETTSTQVKYYEGHKAIAKVYDEILKSSELRSYYQPLKLLDGFPENFQKFMNAGMDGHIELWDIQPVTSLGNYHMEMYSTLPNFHFKFFPKGIQFNAMDYLIYKDHIAIVNAESKYKLTCIIIENKFLYENSKVLFDLMWRLLP